MWPQVWMVILGVILMWSSIGPALRSFIFPKICHDTVAFFHPFTDDGGGGERVLWCAIRTLQELIPRAKFVIYTGDSATADALARRARERFGIRILRPVDVIRLKRRHLLLDSHWPRFTLLGQAYGAVMVTWEAMRLLVPHLFIDTGGYAFGYPVVRAAGALTTCYVHYPYVSTDMLARVRDRQVQYNNQSQVASSAWRSFLKVWYYRAIALAYWFAGRYAQMVMVNSSWTYAHIVSLWRCKAVTRIVYPPCQTTALEDFPLARPESNLLISVAQFRPEKQQLLQLEAFSLARRCVIAGFTGSGVEVLENVNSEAVLRAKLVFVGGCRNEADRERMSALVTKAAQLGLSDCVQFMPGLEYPKLVELLGTAVAGLHSMLDEHFGISVVEYMAAGAIAIAHASGGPKADIVVDLPGKGEDDKHTPTGFLAQTKEEYAKAIIKVLSLSEPDREMIRRAARIQAKKFSNEQFEHSLSNAMSVFVEEMNRRCARQRW
mmetsp:Transcript_44431/g.84994  ORF Transcript_44431/g.84994 Transcript_44431/m.84994 type:complete len:492 (+) Transcript_44431:55-1530(+)|eukprot:CAMPEP_0114225402 /NCGR_PEP_ID=MMETSP0058-20121206/644_1 /TAXON_ID=36894 /ORGANISM="Pyramimonas parkeae, CCMP726" /LENGTH=491 /DNA_ID=CAMNT_0001335987 /DNA_START=43 /DNA_END=1518 /DNA_ORIENTATION=+